MKPAAAQVSDIMGAAMLKNDKKLKRFAKPKEGKSTILSSRKAAQLEAVLAAEYSPPMGLVALGFSRQAQ